MSPQVEFEAPCRTTKFPRQVPELPWYRTTVPQMMMAGFLPFSAIYIELYYIFASIWGYKVRGILEVVIGCALPSHSSPFPLTEAQHVVGVLKHGCQLHHMSRCVCCRGRSD